MLPSSEADMLNTTWAACDQVMGCSWGVTNAAISRLFGELRLMCCSAWFWWLKGHVGYTLSVESLEVSNWAFKKEMSLCGPMVSSRPFTHLTFNTLNSTSKGQETVPTQSLTCATTQKHPVWPNLHKIQRSQSKKRSQKTLFPISLSLHVIPFHSSRLVAFVEKLLVVSLWPKLSIAKRKKTSCYPPYSLL